MPHRASIHKHNPIVYGDVAMEDHLFTEQAELVFWDLLESTIIDVASEAHRAARLGLDPRLSIDEEEEYHLSAQARATVGDSSIKKSKHGMVDIFGQTHPAVANEVFECMSCNRKIMAGRFAPHLEKCMGKGRRSRSKSTSNTKADFQGNSQTSQKAAKTTLGRTSSKSAVSNLRKAHDNGPDANGGMSDDCKQDNVLEKMPRKFQKKTLRQLSRRSARKL